MPIPMSPPPPPYVAPDLRPIVASPSAKLTYERLPGGRIVDQELTHGIWLAAEGAPLELRFHRREDGSIWAEQATYVNGDRADGVARVSAGAHTQVLSRRVVGGLGEVANFVRFTIMDDAGTEIRTWSSPLCTISGAARLDRPGSPAEPTYPTSFESCGDDFDGAYALGRLTALDRGWSAQLPSRVATFAPIRDGRYQLRVDIDPLDALADADRSNDTATVPLRVRTVLSRGGDDFECEFCVPSVVQRSGPRTEPEWYADRLRLVETAVEAQRNHREAGPVPREGEKPPAAPEHVDLPDLQAAPSYGIHTDTIHRSGMRRDLLRFGALTWNAGPGPLEVEAFRESGTTLGAYQVFSRDGERAERQARGTLVWHAAPGHDHFHFTAFARYTLTKLDGALVRDGGKHSWCIVDTTLVDSTRPGYGSGVTGEMRSGNCGTNPGSLWARLSLSVGSGDYYGPDIAGQSFDITTVPNGAYHVRVEANPSGVIAEADHTDNVSTRTVTLGGTRGLRTVVARDHPLVEDRAADDFGD